ncbi:hypothetical protein ASG56_16965 [Rhodococcus sp. Leaf7]|uniref:hypothetical protein n=1 Tax=unclassified Rhodococcus (in: high G+C Gram-positive bacteria) TaxID=192944 RepID=UPI0006F3ADC4|nr:MULTISPECIES: hypothetical protein [unclassified Rhodococcus (in: high G+C Gram-positive bacteria)]KQU02619.1 hypothetical protein ASG56_16965 [Rhodococcus sp. Leaf7]KQU38091.1 hypothetical protein ASG64_19695 [Rhodococcus sp. Leaf247]
MTSGTGRGRTPWWRRLFGKTPPPPLDATREDLVVVASCFDDVEACSATLERAASEEPAWSADDDCVLRHHLLLPADQVADAVSVAAQDGYAEATTGPMAQTPGHLPADVPTGTLLVLQRVQILDALHCSQERSRMAGLAQRRDGVVLGWDALQPAAEPPSGEH